MGMALRNDVKRAREACGQAKPLDLVHLSNQTMGDVALEAEVLSIFRVQARTCFENLQEPANPELLRRTAHTLKGAARGIGAFELARIAAIAEEQGKVPEAMGAEIDAVIAYIDAVLANRKAG